MPNTDNTWTLADLYQWDTNGVSLAVVGHPVSHSLSPCMHNAALRMLAEDDCAYADWHYYKFDIAPEQLAEALPVFHDKGFRGLNLTVPHKVDVLTHGLAIPKDSRVTKIGAANTLKWSDQGYHAYNTDTFGMSRAIAETLYPGNEYPLNGKTIVLLGAGGAARAAAFRCLEEGCRELWIGNRNPERLATLVDALADSRVKTFAPAAAGGLDFGEAPLLINATSVGLKPEEGAPFSFSGRKEAWRVFDMIYNPSQTALLKDAKAHGLTCANGLPMLVWQGALALGIWIETTLAEAEAVAAPLASEMAAALPS